MLFSVHTASLNRLFGHAMVHLHSLALHFLLFVVAQLAMAREGSCSRSGFRKEFERKRIKESGSRRRERLRLHHTEIKWIVKERT